jgi:acetolactate synthase-1/2/3 large subunit
MMKEVPVESTADAYLEMLVARGIDYFFGNGGTDFGPIAEAYAKRMATEQPVPKTVTVPHEITGTAMAMGYAMITGRPQVMMVHTIAGTANAIGSLISANRSNIPIFFTAGRTPISEIGMRGARNGGIQWGQESWDQGGMVREWVKWDYELRHGNDLESVVDRALAISQTEPKGPVYLTLPREVLAEERETVRYSEKPRMKPGVSVPSPDAIHEAAAALAKAKNPIVIVGASGRDPAAVAPLVRLAELLNLPVFGATGNFLNFPQGNGLYQPTPAGPQVPKADVILVAEIDVPWMPSTGNDAAEDAAVIALGHDPLYENYPVRGFRADITLRGSPAFAFNALADAIESMPVDRGAVEARGQRWREAHDKAHDANLARAEAGREKAPIDKAWFSHCFEQVRHDNMIIVNELGLDHSFFKSNVPGSYFSYPPAGVLGWGIGAGLGAKLAARDKTVVTCVGDGSYMFGVPEASHWISRQMNLPMLTIVWNNSQWGAVAGATRGVYPDGWAAKNNNFVFSDLSPSLDFSKICESAEGYAERVSRPEDVPAALQRALHAVEVEGRQALLDVIGASR